MARNWDSYSRQGIDLAHFVSSVGFGAAKFGTRIGFSIARTIASTAVGVTTTVVDFTFFGGYTVTRPVFGTAVSTVITLAEQITLAPIHLSEYITSTSLVAAHGSINVLSVVFPGSSDASFSLASFIDLVRREWSGGDMSAKQFGLTQISCAIVGWCALQGITQEWQEKQWFKYLREIDIKEPPKSSRISRRKSRIRVTSDVIFPGQQGPQIIAADIGEPVPTRSRASSTYSFRSLNKSSLSVNRNRAARSGIPPEFITSPTPLAEHKANLRRLSKMVLAGYGGATLLFFGVSPTHFSIEKSTAEVFSGSKDIMAQEKKDEEIKLANAIEASEAEAAGDATGEQEENKEYSWWDLILGKHDREIFELSTTLGDSAAKKQTENKGKMKATAVIGNEHLMPRFWVLTDHGRNQIILVIRGTMSLNEIAVDLTCEPDSFQPASTQPLPSSSDESDDEENHIPGTFAFPSISKNDGKEDDSDASQYQVHGGILKLARAMGEIGKPVHLAVLEALYNNPDYDLILCGHSLGAGVASILGMMWADPKTCLTVRSSGLPVGRRVQVYCFAPPSVADANLARLSDKLIVSLVYSHDIVSRLSLGSVLDLRNAAMWLCEAEANGGKADEGWSAVIQRARRWKAGEGNEEDMNWFIAMRKTLEANMQSTILFPPGRVLWAMRDGDLHTSHQRYRNSPGPTSGKRLRVFEVIEAEKVFSQIVFARNMLTAHMPHRYDMVIHDLL